MNAPRYKELDSLRGFAALFVVFFHYTTNTAFSLPLLELGVTGVDLFFIISGFVIFMSIDHIKTAKQFIVNRVARLYPTYIAAVTFTTLLCLSVNYIYKNEQTITFYKYFANITMFQHYLRAENIDGTYWTLTIEMVFYIFIVILFKFKLLKHIIKISVIMLVFIAIWDIYIQATSDFLYRTIRYIFPLINHYPLFFAGILFYKRATGQTKNFTKYILLILCLVTQIILYNNGGSAQNYISQYSYGTMLVFYFIIFLLFINQRLKFIINKPALFFGKISFALYLIHQYISIDVIIPILTKQFDINFFIASTLAFIISVALSVGITYYIELPIGKRVKHFLIK